MNKILENIGEKIKIWAVIILALCIEVVWMSIMWTVNHSLEQANNTQRTMNIINWAFFVVTIGLIMLLIKYMWKTTK